MIHDTKSKMIFHHPAEYSMSKLPMEVKHEVTDHNDNAGKLTVTQNVSNVYLTNYWTLLDGIYLTFCNLPLLELNQSKPNIIGPKYLFIIKPYLFLWEIRQFLRSPMAVQVKCIRQNIWSNITRTVPLLSPIYIVRDLGIAEHGKAFVLGTLSLFTKALYINHYGIRNVMFKK